MPSQTLTPRPDFFIHSRNHQRLRPMQSNYLHIDTMLVNPKCHLAPLAGLLPSILEPREPYGHQDVPTDFSRFERSD